MPERDRNLWLPPPWHLALVSVVAAVSTFVAEAGCSITESHHFNDPQSDRFFTRTVFAHEPGGGLDMDAFRQGFAPIAERFSIRARIGAMENGQLNDARAMLTGTLRLRSMVTLASKRSASLTASCSSALGPSTLAGELTRSRP